ncbi:MAG: hypothetical protein HRF49_06190 [bacterium]|jgi:hypothetical protein
MKIASTFFLALTLALVAFSRPGFAQMQGGGDTALAYAYGMNDLSVKVVAVIYNYAGMVWESFDGGTLDSTNAQLELEYVEDILYDSYDIIDGILATTSETEPVYEILSPHMDCYVYFTGYMKALRAYFADPSDSNLDNVYDKRGEVEPYMEAIGLKIGSRGEV